MKTSAATIPKMWMGDFAHITCDTHTEFLCVMVNPSTRTLLSLSRGREFTAALVIDGLEQAKERENTPEEICFDGGIRRLPDYDVLKKYAYKHKSCIRERSTVPEELVIRNIYQLITDDMKCSLKEFVDSYNSWTWLHLKVKGMLHTVSQYDKDGENA